MLTEKEVETLEALIKHKTLQEAANALNIKDNTLSQRMSRMRLKESKFEGWLEQYRRYKMRMPLKYVE